MIQRFDAQPKFEGISPVFPVSNVPAAVAFYRERLGFDLGWIWGEPPTHANVCRGAVGINLNLESPKAGGGEAYVELRDFALTDPDGNRLVFGESIVA
jgi:hypothetical protein